MLFLASLSCYYPATKDRELRNSPSNLSSRTGTGVCHSVLLLLASVISSAKVPIVEPR